MINIRIAVSFPSTDKHCQYRLYPLLAPTTHAVCQPLDEQITGIKSAYPRRFPRGQPGSSTMINPVPRPQL